MALQDTLISLKKGSAKFSNGFTPGQKVLTLVGVAGLLIASIFFMKLTSAPSYGVLYSNLSGTDAASITTKLQSANIPYELTNGGNTIMVPQSDVYAERNLMAQAGLPQSSTGGLSSLSSIGITSSQTATQAAYQNALQNEIISTLEAIQGVSAAQVNLALPPTDVFAVSQNQTTTASVILTLSSGTTLSPTQVQGVVHLVASSIPNLSATNVTVVDQYGDVLAAPGFDTSTSQNSSATQAFETALSTSLTSLLQNSLGANHVSVKVAAQLNFNTTSTSQSTLQTTPAGTPITVPTQVTTSNTTYTGTGATPGGVLGTITPVSSSNSTSNYSSTNSTTNLAVGQINQTVKQAPGQIQQLSVAVMVDSKVKGVSIASIKSLISAAAGLQPARGDTISVVKMPFTAAATAATVTAAAASGGSASLFSLVKTVLLVLGVLVALFLVVRSSRKETREELAIPQFDAPLSLNAGQQSITIGLPSSLSAPPLISEEVFDFIDNQPDDVAKLLRIWMQSRVDA